MCTGRRVGASRLYRDSGGCSSVALPPPLDSVHRKCYDHFLLNLVSVGRADLPVRQARAPGACEFPSAASVTIHEWRVRCFGVRCLRAAPRDRRIFHPPSSLRLCPRFLKIFKFPNKKPKICLRFRFPSLYTQKCARSADKFSRPSLVNLLASLF